LYLFPDVNLTLEISNVSAGAEEKQLAELESLATAKASYSSYSKMLFSYAYWGITICAGTFQSTSALRTAFHTL
jgi:hypothetical protein